jgi:hypothetical protein
VAGRGIGAIGAVFAAIDGAERLWDDTGFWRAPGVAGFYRWRPAVRVLAWAAAASAVIVAVPLAALVAGLIVFPIDFVLKMLGAGGSGGLVGLYLSAAQAAFAPEMLPTWLPRFVFLVLLAAGIVAAVTAAGRGRRRGRGAWWWGFVPAPLSAGRVIAECRRRLWDVIRGASRRASPEPAEQGRRYVELLGENLGQPGFRELLIVAHDIDTRRDLVFALAGEAQRHKLLRRATIREADTRRGEVIDLAGPGREHVLDAVAAALAVPLATECHTMTFAPDAYWRGESHRLCDRPPALIRMIDELADLEVEQILIVSAVAPSEGPHMLGSPRLDGRARLGEWMQSAEAAAVRDALAHASRVIPRVFVIQPIHSAVGPFDFDGGYDDRSDRRQPLGELIDLGFVDAHQQFIDPIVGASGDHLARGMS